MSEATLLVRLFEDGGAEWALLDAGAGLLQGPRRGLPDPADAAGARLVVLAPGEQVLITRARVPTRNPVRLLRALPYAVEDRLLGDADAQHVAAGGQNADGEVPAAVVERERMTRWLEMLADAGLRPDAMIPEPLALPAPETGAVVLLEGGRAIVRLADGTGFAGEADWVPTLLGDSEEPAVYRAGETPGEPAAPGAWPGAVALDVPALAWLARGLNGGIDLLQGQFRPRGRDGASRVWRVAAALVLAWGILELAFAGADYWRLARQSDELESRITGVFTQAFPDARPVDPRAQMAQRLAGLGTAGGGALALMHRVAPILAARDGLRLQSLEFRDGTLTLALHAGSLADLDALRGALAGQPGLHAELASASASEKGVDGRLTISGAGA